MVNEPLHFIILAEKNKSGAEKMGIPSPRCVDLYGGDPHNFFAEFSLMVYSENKSET